MENSIFKDIQNIKEKSEEIQKTYPELARVLGYYNSLVGLCMSELFVGSMVFLLEDIQLMYDNVTIFSEFTKVSISDDEEDKDAIIFKAYKKPNEKFNSILGNLEN